MISGLQNGWDTGASRPALECYRLPAAVVLLMTLAAMARLWGITSESAWNDEVLTLKYLGAPTLSEYLRGCFTEDPVPVISPVYYLLQYAWAQAFGPSVLAARLLSVTLGVLAIPLLVWLGGLLSNARAALIAGALFSLSMVQVYYAQEVRFYALLNAEALLSSIALVSALQRPALYKWGLYGAANTAMLFTHTFAPLLFAAQGAFLLWHWRKELWRVAAWGGGHALLLGVFFLWAKYVVGYDFSAQAGVFNDIPPSWRELLMTVVVFAGGRFSNENPAPYMPGGISVDVPIALLFMLLAIMGVRQGKNIALLVCWLLIPLAVLYTASLLWKPMFLYRYALHAAIPLTLLAAIGIQGIPNATLRRGLLAAVLLALAWQNFSLPRPFRPDYATFAQRVQAGSADAPVVALKPFVSRPAQYALGDASRVRTFVGIQDFKSAVSTECEANDAVWIVCHRWDDIGTWEKSVKADGLHVETHWQEGIPPLYSAKVTKP